MKQKFPILAKVIILGIGVSILTAGTAIVLSYVNQKKRSEETLINNIDNSLDEASYAFSMGKEYVDYMSDLKAVRNYIENIYDTDTDKKVEDDFPTFEEFANYYKDKYPWIYPNSSGIGLSKDMAVFKASYYRITSLLTSCQLSSGTRAAFFAYTDKDNNLVMLSDSRLTSTDATVTSYYHVPGSFYKIKNSDYVIDDAHKRYRGYILSGYLTRFVDIVDNETLPNGQLEANRVATLFIEYDLGAIENESISILKTELLVLGFSSITLVIIYALFSYLLFVKNINKLSKASGEIRQKLIDKNMNEVVDVRIKSNDEIKVLAISFEEMEREIINYVDIIRKETLEKEKINAELGVASKIQIDSLPENRFDDNNISLRSYIKPAKEVGGDFYDYFYLDDHRLALIISDVSGKGVPASLFMMKGKELIKSTLTSYKTLSDAIKHANNAITRNNKELLFITSFIGVIDFEKNEIKYINAGHEKPYIVSNGKVIKLDGEANVVLGVEDDYSFIEEFHPFKKGDYIFMYTDGLNESINHSFEEFSYQRIEENLTNTYGASLDDIIEKINHSLEEFVDKEEQFDDVTMMIVLNKDNKLSLHYEKKDYEVITDIVDRFENAFSSLNTNIKASVGIIIDELVNNLISYEEREDLVIDVEFALTKDELEIIITSNGNDYNPFANHKEKYLEEYHSEIKEGGFGLSIVKDLTKSYSYDYKNGHSIIRLVIENK